MHLVSYLAKLVSSSGTGPVPPSGQSSSVLISFTNGNFHSVSEVVTTMVLSTFLAEVDMFSIATVSLSIKYQFEVGAGTFKYSIF